MSISDFHFEEEIRKKYRHHIRVYILIYLYTDQIVRFYDDKSVLLFFYI